MLFNKRCCGMQPMMPSMDGCGCEATCCPPIECPCDPVMDPPVERIVRRDIIHNIQHIDPINTRVINNHIFRHSYTPHYTCCEENVCTVDPCCNPCGNPCCNPCGNPGSNF